MQIFHREYWNCTGNTSIYPDHICDDEINDKKGEEDMLMILGFILLFLIMIIGGDRGVISLISLTKIAMALDIADELRNIFTHVPYKDIQEVINEGR